MRTMTRPKPHSRALLGALLAVALLAAQGFATAHAAEHPASAGACLACLLGGDLDSPPTADTRPAMPTAAAEYGQQPCARPDGPCPSTPPPARAPPIVR